MRQADRLNAIMERLARDGHVAVSALSQGFGVSEASVRRDLALLEAQRWIERTHGGAVARTAPAAIPLGRHADDRQAQRFRMAEAATAHLSTGARVGLAAGRAAGAVGRALIDRGPRTVLTNALDVAYELSTQPDLQVVVAGGLVDRSSHGLTGPLTELALRDRHLDVVFVSGDGLSARAGLTAEDEAVAGTTRAFAEAAELVIATVDGDALGRTAYARACGLERLDVLITDARPDPELRERLDRAGVRVEVVQRSAP
jgi:DeoR family transcriptional regulator of aga operon